MRHPALRKPAGRQTATHALPATPPYCPPPTRVLPRHDAGGAIPQRQGVCTKGRTICDANHQAAQEALADAHLPGKGRGGAGRQLEAWPIGTVASAAERWRARTIQLGDWSWKHTLPTAHPHGRVQAGCIRLHRALRAIECIHGADVGQRLLRDAVGLCTQQGGGDRLGIQEGGTPCPAGQLGATSSWFG